MLCLNNGNIALSSGSTWCTSNMNEMKKAFWMFIFENFLKEAKFFVPTTKLELELYTLRDKCPNMEFFLVRIFLYSVRIFKKRPENTPYLDTSTQ